MKLGDNVMKKLLTMFCICLISILMVGCLSTPTSFERADESIDGNNQNNIIETNAYDDYPLIDIYFNDDSSWYVIIRENLFEETEKFIVAKNSTIIEENKEYLKLSTFPIGRGTTPCGELYIYKNGILYKRIPFLKVFFGNKVLEEEFRAQTQEVIEEEIGDRLPSPV